jgi:hypothetical protein
MMDRYSHNKGRMSAFARERQIAYELKLLHREMQRQDRLDWRYHDSDCACWGCVLRLHASVVKANVRRMHEEEDSSHRSGRLRQGDG